MSHKITGLIAGTLLILNVLFLPLVVLSLTPLKLLLPETLVRKYMDPLYSALAYCWIALNSGWMKLTQNTEWDVEISDKLNKKGWYFVTSNHQSWVDILVLQHCLNGKIPFLKFFLKQELIKVPIMGWTWWALDFPFMKRFSRSYLEKHPEMKGKDVETTRIACEKFKHMPTSVMNFMEGTRFTPEKHAKQESPYEYLLKPKSGGFAFALNAMGDKFDSLLDFHIVYPGGIPSFTDFLQGKVEKVVVRMREIPIPAEMTQGDYENDEEFRKKFQDWISEMWLQKGEEMKALHSELRLSSSQLAEA